MGHKKRPTGVVRLWASRDRNSGGRIVHLWDGEPLFDVDNGKWRAHGAVCWRGELDLPDWAGCSDGNAVPVKLGCDWTRPILDRDGTSRCSARERGES